MGNLSFLKRHTERTMGRRQGTHVLSALSFVPIEASFFMMTCRTYLCCMVVVLGALGIWGTSDAQEGNVLTLEELAIYNGMDGQAAYIAVDGVVYDVSQVPEWIEGYHNGFDAGQDLSEEIKNLSPHGVSKLEGLPIVGTLAATAQEPSATAPKTGPSPEVRRTNILFLGWLNVLLVALAGSLFVLRRVNRNLYDNKQAVLKKVVRSLSRAHMPIGIAIVILAFIHGYMALGTVFRMHTGPLAWWIVVAMMLVALLGKKYRITQWIKIHRWGAGVFVFALFLHLFMRNLL